MTKNDPRVTRVGRFIRKTSIDELPQFFNALLGSLSLVGPRPHAIAAQSHNKLYNEVVDGYFARHKRQARRHRLGADQWLARRDGHRREDPACARSIDLYYIENWSLLFDSADPAPDAGPPAQHGKRVLSAVSHELPSAAVNAKLIALIASRAVFLGVFLSGFVIDEPAPYDLYMAGLIAVWALFGLRISRRRCRCWCCSSRSTSAA